MTSTIGIVTKGVWGTAVPTLIMPIWRIYPVIDRWLQNWLVPSQARLSQGAALMSGYQLSVELSQEEGDHLLGSLLEDEEVQSERSQEVQRYDEVE